MYDTHHRSPKPRLSRRQRRILALLAAGGEMAGLEPVVRDLRQEYIAALANRRRWKARWVRLRGTWAFWSAVAGLLPLSALSFLFRRSK